MEQPQRSPETAMPVPESKPPSDRRGILGRPDFWIGASLCVLLNAALGGLQYLLYRLNENARFSTFILLLIPAAALLANILGPVLLWRSRPTMAKGMLYTLAFLLVVAGMCVPVFLVVALCFVPY